MSSQIVSIEEIIEISKRGEMFILMDDENRENEGDLIVPSCFIDEQKVNFMITYGRGLLCTPVSSEIAKRLDFPLMTKDNTSNFQTNFTVSVNLKHGITTGISPEDRAKTILAIANQNATKDEFTRPGHIFPLIANDLGVLERAGHTEASVEIMKLANLTPSATICEIINDNGKMARLDDLKIFADKHQLKIGLIKDLIAYKKSGK